MSPTEMFPAGLLSNKVRLLPRDAAEVTRCVDPELAERSSRGQFSLDHCVGRVYGAAAVGILEGVDVSVETSKELTDHSHHLAAGGEWGFSPGALEGEVEEVHPISLLLHEVRAGEHKAHLLEISLEESEAYVLAAPLIPAEDRFPGIRLKSPSRIFPFAAEGFATDGLRLRLLPFDESSFVLEAPEDEINPGLLESLGPSGI